MLCGSRKHSPAGVAVTGPEDEWREMPDGTRTCSFCGSMRQEDLLRICEAIQDGKPGFEFEWSDKAYKIYAQRPGVQNASEGAIKFYTWHLERDVHGVLAKEVADLINGTHQIVAGRLQSAGG